MNAKHLLTLYDRVVDAPDAIFRLRQFVLDLAVRGKLVEQDPADEPASELLKRIVAAKNTIIKERRIRRRKILPALKVDSFPIPENWYWTRIREIASDRGQKIPDKPFTYIDVSAIDKENGLVSLPRVLEADKAPSRARKVAHQGDVIYSCVRPYLLNVAVIEDDFNPPPIVSTAFEILDGHGLVLPRYIWIVLRSPFIIKCVEENQRGQAYPAIKSTDFALLPFPLPPLAEQRRIVDKVDELFTLCDRLEESRTTREKTRDRLTKATLTRISTPDTNVAIFRAHARFAIDALPALTARVDQIKDLRQTILNLAVRGKLAEQDPADEPASELLKRIDEKKDPLVGSYQTRKSLTPPKVDPTIIPFELPSAWQWTYFGNIVDFSAGKTPPRKEPSLWNTGDFSWVSIADMNDGTTLLSTKETVSTEAQNNVFKRQPESPGTMIMSFKLTIGKIAILGIPAFHNEAIISIRPHVDELKPFLFKVLPDLARGANTKNAIKGATLNRKSLSTIMVPIPPLAEQYRIVAKVDELMTLCDQLNESIASTDSVRTCLLETLLRDTIASSANASA